MGRLFCWQPWTSREASWEGCFVGSHRYLIRSGPHGKFVLLAAIDVS